MGMTVGRALACIALVAPPAWSEDSLPEPATAAPVAPAAPASAPPAPAASGPAASAPAECHDTSGVVSCHEACARSQDARCLPEYFEPPHPCAEDPLSDGCDAACRGHFDERACRRPCAAQSGIRHCFALCQAEPDAVCAHGYREQVSPTDAEPVFSESMWRVGAHITAGAQFHDRLAGYLGAELVVGRRTSSILTWVLLGHAAFAIDERPRPVAALGLELGAEVLFHDALWRNSALALTPAAGIWTPGGCEDDRCPVALPMGSLSLTQIDFGRSAAPRAEGFTTKMTFGVEGGVGYDPFLDLALGRVGLLFGWDLAFF